MPRIKVTKAFKHVDAGEVHPRLYSEGEQEVSDRCAEVAIENRWAVAAEGKQPARPTGSRTGKAKRSSSSRPARRSSKAKSTKPKAAKSSQSTVHGSSAPGQMSSTPATSNGGSVQTDSKPAGSSGA